MKNFNYYVARMPNVSLNFSQKGQFGEAVQSSCMPYLQTPGVKYSW